MSDNGWSLLMFYERVKGIWQEKTSGLLYSNTAAVSLSPPSSGLPVDAMARSRILLRVG